MRSRLSALLPASENPRRVALTNDTARLLAHHRFQYSAARYCTELIADPLPWPVPKLLGHEARYIICFTLIANHARWRAMGGDPPTLAALKASPYASDRQVAEFVARLRQAGLVTAVHVEGDRRVLALEPSLQLIAEIGRHPRLAVQLYGALAQPDPWVGADLPAQTMVALMIRTSSPDGETLSEGPFSTIASLARQDCGYFILAAVLLAYYAERGNHDTVQVDLTQERLAKRFGVSPRHVGHVFDTARVAGWFDIARGGTLRAISSDLTREFEYFLAEQAAHFGWVARDLLR